MIAILLAAQLSATVVGASSVGPAFPPNRLPVSPEVLCQSSGPTQASAASPSMLLRPQDRRDIGPRKLADLPKANAEVAVARTVGGCAVPVGIRYSVERDGKFATGR